MRIPDKKEEGTRLILSGYSDQLIQMANNCSTWVFWHHPADASRNIIVNNGSVFFLDAGKGPFGVTASHVIQGLQDAKQKYQKLGIQIGNISFDPSERVIDNDPFYDVATFRIDERTIASLGKRPHVDPRHWPPPPPQENKGVFFGGYRGPDDKFISTDKPIPYDFWHGFGPITGVFNKQLTMRFQRDDWVHRSGHPNPPIGAEWGGVSGGPMFALFETEVVYFRLCGVTKEYSATAELMVFAPIGRIRMDGRLSP
jgi:hypothetical protein